MQKMWQGIRVVPGDCRPRGYVLQILERFRPETDVALLFSPEGERLVCHRLQWKEGPGRRKEERGQGPRNGKKSTSVQDQIRRIIDHSFPFAPVLGYLFRRRRCTRNLSTASWEASLS